MKIHAPLLPLAVSMIAGIWMSQRIDDWLVPLGVLAIVVVTICCIGRYPRLQTAGIIVGTLLLGMVLGSRQRQQLNVEWSQERQLMEVVVTSEVKVKEKTVVFDALTADGQHKLRCSIQRDNDSEQIQIGQGLEVYTRIKKVHEYHNGHFDYLQYMVCHGFTGELYAYSNQWQWEAVSLKELSVTDRLRLRFLTWRHQLLKHFQQQEMDDDAYGVITAMTLGEKTALSKEVKETFSRVGASHILALSGLHLMIIYSVITLVIGWHRYRIVTQATLVLAIWAFALLTGLSTSVVRSAFMISIYALLSLGYRERMSVNTLAFVAIVLLVVNPLAMYDLGFQLSFLSVLGILLIHPLINNLLKADVQQQHRWLSSIWGLVTVSIAAQMSTAPLVAYHFGRFSCWFLLSNFIVVPMAWLVLNVALLCIVFSWWSWAFSGLTTILAWLATAMNHALGWVAQLPCSSIEVIDLSAVQVYLIYIIIACSYVAISLRYPAARRSG
jgi:competence protein ComEC